MSAGTARRTSCAGPTSISVKASSLRSWGRRGPEKATLLGILGMLDGDFEGEFHFLDQPVHKLKPRQRVELNKQYIGFVFQSYHLLDDMTVYENLDLRRSPTATSAARSASRLSPTCLIASTSSPWPVLN